MFFLNDLFLQIEILDRRYRQLASEYEAFRSQPQVSYSEYELRYAEVCVFLAYYFIAFSYQSLGKTQLPRTSTVHLVNIRFLNDLFLQIETLDRRYRQLASEYEALRSQPRISYSEYEVRYAEVCILFVYYSMYFSFKTLGKAKFTRTSRVFRITTYFLNDLFVQIEIQDRRYRQLSSEYEALRSQPRVSYSEYEVRYAEVCVSAVYWFINFFCQSLGKTKLARTSRIHFATMGFLNDLFVQIEILDRRYSQLASEYEAFRSQPQVSYSEYELRYAEVCVFLAYYLIYCFYQSLGKTKLPRTGIFSSI